MLNYLSPQAHFIMAGVGTRFLLVYASQTGQAQAIAEEIAEKAPQHGLTVEMHCMSLTEKKVRERRGIS